MNDRSEYITVDEAARMLRCSTATVYRHIKRGDIAASKFGRRWLISWGSIDAALNAK